MAHHPWILFLDADEEVSYQLRDAILREVVRANLVGPVARLDEVATLIRGEKLPLRPAAMEAEPPQPGHVPESAGADSKDDDAPSVLPEPGNQPA